MRGGRGVCFPTPVLGCPWTEDTRFLAPRISLYLIMKAAPLSVRLSDRIRPRQLFFGQLYSTPTPSWLASSGRALVKRSLSLGVPSPWRADRCRERPKLQEKSHFCTYRALGGAGAGSARSAGMRPGTR